MGWLFVFIAIVSEAIGTMSLRAAVGVHKAWYVSVISTYAVAFGALVIALDKGVPLGAAYGIWTACGVALTAILGWAIFKEPLTRRMIGGILLVFVGVILVESGATH